MATTEHNVVKMKLALLELAKELGSVSRACNLLGYSRDSFYRFKALYEKGGEVALKDLPRKKPNLKNRVATEIENEILRLTFMQPLWGPVTMARELRRRGMTVSPAGVRGIWVRHDLETIRKRLKALEPRKPSETTGETITTGAREPDEVHLGDSDQPNKLITSASPHQSLDKLSAMTELFAR